MHKLNRQTEYALMTLAHLSTEENRGQERQPVSARELSRHFAIPFEVTARVLQKLSKQKWLLAESGNSGGYRLAVDLRKKSFFDLLQVVDGRTEIARCLGGACPTEKDCNVVRPTRYLNGRLQNFYRSISLFELLEDQSGV